MTPSQDKSDNKHIATPIAYIQIGDCVGRLVICPDGKSRLYIDPSAKNDIVFMADIGANIK